MSPYKYPSTRHDRKHGPRGYADYAYYKPWLRDEFTFRCVYCLHRERWTHSGDGTFGADHFVPQTVDASLGGEYDNLVYCCSRCNSFKREKVVLDPCVHAFSAHLRVNDDGSIEGLTPEAKEHIMILGLDDTVLVEFRNRLIRTIKTLLDPSDRELLSEWLAYPVDLPNLALLRPPGGNQRPFGTETCAYELRRRGTLSNTC